MKNKYIKSAQLSQRRREIEKFIELIEQNPRLEQEYMKNIRKKVNMNKKMINKFYASVYEI